MGRNDYGKTPNVWQPSEVPPPFTGHDLGVGQAPTYGTVTTTTVTEYGYPPTSGGVDVGATGRGWRLLFDRSPELRQTNGVFEFHRFDIEPSTAALQVVSIWHLHNLDTANQRIVTFFMRPMPNMNVDLASVQTFPLLQGAQYQSLVLFLFTGVWARRVDDDNWAICAIGGANHATVAQGIGGQGVPNNSGFGALHVRSNAYPAGGVGPGWLDSNNPTTLALFANGTSVQMTLRRIQVRVNG